MVPALLGLLVMLLVSPALGGPGLAGELVRERRNVREDWRRAFGQDIEAIDAVAIMTDTDNSGQKARAWYGQPWFSSD